MTEISVGLILSVRIKHSLYAPACALMTLNVGCINPARSSKTLTPGWTKSRLNTESSSPMPNALRSHEESSFYESESEKLDGLYSTLTASRMSLIFFLLDLLVRDRVLVVDGFGLGFETTFVVTLCLKVSDLTVVSNFAGDLECDDLDLDSEVSSAGNWQWIGFDLASGTSSVGDLALSLGTAGGSCVCSSRIVSFCNSCSTSFSSVPKRSL